MDVSDRIKFFGFVLIVFSYSDYYAALLRTQHSLVAPTQGNLLNYVQRIPLGVVAQITVSIRRL